MKFTASRIRAAVKLGQQALETDRSRLIDNQRSYKRDSQKLTDAAELLGMVPAMVRAIDEARNALAKVKT